MHFAAGAVRKTLRLRRRRPTFSRQPSSGWEVELLAVDLGRDGTGRLENTPARPLEVLQFQKRVATDGRALSVLGQAQAAAIAGPAPETRPRTTLPEQAARPREAVRIVRGRIPDWTPRPGTEARGIWWTGPEQARLQWRKGWAVAKVRPGSGGTGTKERRPGGEAPPWPARRADATVMTTDGPALRPGECAPAGAVSVSVFATSAELSLSAAAEQHLSSDVVDEWLTGRTGPTDRAGDRSSRPLGRPEGRRLANMGRPPCGVRQFRVGRGLGKPHAVATARRYRAWSA